MSNAKKLSNRFADVGEFQSTAFRLAGNVEPNQCTETQAVHVSKRCEIEHDSLAAWKQLPDLGVEITIHPCH